MLTLEEIRKRFMARELVEPRHTAIEPRTPQGERPIVVNGLAQLLAYLADLDQRVKALEEEIKKLQPTG